MALQRACRSGFAGDLCRDAAHAGGAEGPDQQDRPQRCTRDCADDAGGALSSGACEDVTQPETADAADASQAALQSAWTAKGPGTSSYLTLRQSRLRVPLRRALALIIKLSTRLHPRSFSPFGH